MNKNISKRYAVEEMIAVDYDTIALSLASDLKFGIAICSVR
jgi:hypothetical protein